MNGKPGSRSPASRLRGLAFSRSLGGGRVYRPKLRKALSVNSESELFKAVDGGSREALDDLVMSKTPPLKSETCSSPVKVLSFKLRASSWKERDSRGSPSSIEAETVNKHDGVNFEAQKGCELDCKEFSSKIQDLIQQVLSSHLDNMEYNHEICGAKCKTISQMIENGVKSLFSARYKIIALVYIGAIRDRGIEMASQCLWNPSTDSFVMATFDNNSLFATATVFATLFNDE